MQWRLHSMKPMDHANNHLSNNDQLYIIDTNVLVAGLISSQKESPVRAIVGAMLKGVIIYVIPPYTPTRISRRIATPKTEKNTPPKMALFQGFFVLLMIFSVFGQFCRLLRFFVIFGLKVYFL